MGFFTFYILSFIIKTVHFNKFCLKILTTNFNKFCNLLFSQILKIYNKYS